MNQCRPRPGIPGSSDPPIALFSLFCCYALSGYIYGAIRWWRGEGNPARPARPGDDDG